MGVFLEKNRKKLLFFGGFAAGLFAAFKYLLPLAAPFLIAFLVVYLCDPWLSKMQKKTHIRKEILLGAFFLFLAGLFAACVWGFFSWGTVQAAELGENAELVQRRLDRLMEDCCSFAESRFGLDAAYAEELILERAGQAARHFREELLPRAARQSLEYCRGLLSAAAFLGVGLISSLLLCRDYQGIVEKMEESPLLEALWQYAGRTVSLIGGYVRAQTLILLAISAIAVAGLLIGRVGHAAALGLLAGLLDALPFIGTGIVLLPTALWQLFCGNIPQAAAVAVTYVLCVTARELLEPKLLGRQVGICPAVMLLAVYAGVKVFGFCGIFLGPLYAVLLREGARRIFGGADAAAEG
ncbi:MAG: AI-2E family transporter [Eubacteriales bacterium]|nr:AI-2E family transporter [Eubacteriales bacterium]